MPKVGTTRAYRYYADRYYLDRANRDTYIYRESSGNVGFSGVKLLALAGGAGSYITAPVLTTTQRDALTAVEGMVIFNSTTDQLEEYDGAVWEAIGQVILDTHIADLDAHTRNLYQILKIGNYYLFIPFDPSRDDASGSGANQIYTFPFVIARDLTIDRIAVHVTTTHLNNNYRLGIYSDDGLGAPGALLLNAGTVSTTNAGVQAITISQALTKGIYHWAIHSSTATARVTGYRPTYPLLGFPTTDFRDTWRAGVSLSRAYASGLPDPFGTPTGEISTPCCVFGRLLSLD